MRSFDNFVDITVDKILSDFATEIIKTVSKKTKLDTNTLAVAVPGLLHSHWYISGSYVDGCEFCAKIRRCNSGGATNGQIATDDHAEGSG